MIDSRSDDLLANAVVTLRLAKIIVLCLDKDLIVNTYHYQKVAHSDHYELGSVHSTIVSTGNHRILSFPLRNFVIACDFLPKTQILRMMTICDDDDSCCDYRLYRQQQQ